MFESLGRGEGKAPAAKTEAVTGISGNILISSNLRKLNSARNNLRFISVLREPEGKFSRESPWERSFQKHMLSQSSMTLHTLLPQKPFSGSLFSGKQKGADSDQTGGRCIGQGE